MPIRRLTCLNPDCGSNQIQDHCANRKCGWKRCTKCRFFGVLKADLGKWKSSSGTVPKDPEGK